MLIHKALKNNRSHTIISNFCNCRKRLQLGFIFPGIFKTGLGMYEKIKYQVSWLSPTLTRVKVNVLVTMQVYEASNYIFWHILGKVLIETCNYCRICQFYIYLGNVRSNFFKNQGNDTGCWSLGSIVSYPLGSARSHF